MSKCPLIAKAIVYAARQAQLINEYGMTWEAIETNTANILAGCSVPADGKMNSAEAVANSINDALKRGLISPDDARETMGRYISPTPWAVRRTSMDFRDGRGPRVKWNIQAANGRHLGHMLDETDARELVRLVNSGGAVGLELVDKYHAQKHETENQRRHVALRCRERDEARRERDKALEAYNALRESMRPHPDHELLESLQRQVVDAERMESVANCARHTVTQERDTAVNKVRELRADLDEMGSNYRRINELLQDASQDLTRMTTDRDGYRKGAQFWMDEANAARAKVEKLRTFLRDIVAYPMSGDTNSINHILEQTK